jgi:hypothetical protein
VLVLVWSGCASRAILSPVPVTDSLILVAVDLEDWGSGEMLVDAGILRGKRLVVLQENELRRPQGSELQYFCVRGEVEGVTYASSRRAWCVCLCGMRRTCWQLGWLLLVGSLVCRLTSW